MALIENCRALGALAPDGPAPPGASRLILRVLEGLLFGIQPKAEIAANMGRLPALKAPVLQRLTEILRRPSILSHVRRPHLPALEEFSGRGKIFAHPTRSTLLTNDQRCLGGRGAEARPGVYPGSV